MNQGGHRDKAIHKPTCVHVMYTSQHLLSRMGGPIFLRRENLLQMQHSLYIQLKEADSSFQGDKESIWKGGNMELF